MDVDVDDTVHPPFRFGHVEHGLYRGSYPRASCLRHLRRLQLRTLLSLTPDPPEDHVVRFCTSNNIALIHVRVDRPKENVPLSFARTAAILSLLVDPENHPLFYHCLDGSGVTGIVTMCLRKLQGWTPGAAATECLRFHKEGELESEEADFARTFRAEVELPLTLPRWLWGGSYRDGTRGAAAATDDGNRDQLGRDSAAPASSIGNGNTNGNTAEVKMKSAHHDNNNNNNNNNNITNGNGNGNGNDHNENSSSGRNSRSRAGSALSKHGNSSSMHDMTGSFTHRERLSDAGLRHQVQQQVQVQQQQIQQQQQLLNYTQDVNNINNINNNNSNNNNNDDVDQRSSNNPLTIDPFRNLWVISNSKSKKPDDDSVSRLFSKSI